MRCTPAGSTAATSGCMEPPPSSSQRTVPPALRTSITRSMGAVVVARTMRGSRSRSSACGATGTKPRQPGETREASAKPSTTPLSMCAVDSSAGSRVPRVGAPSEAMPLSSGISPAAVAFTRSSNEAVAPSAKVPTHTRVSPGPSVRDSAAFEPSPESSSQRTRPSASTTASTRSVDERVATRTDVGSLARRTSRGCWLT
ncbi:MAG: hypothetical protein EDQ89_13300 [Acidobacteria bacterium]|nr:MAG: hypothetical protein EDQ89_13300 [Acidobacteriota bacterium]